ncbi:MAG: bifunctional homocysteine S-methyltransferase/methylenetetrahydrofolate reductase [Phycisphaerae bacterium]|nr:bifunctional homocysteine S-methyltransferase/methylenetetrahydrofolate reductase [Phycisphaerae bacterium]
MNLLEKLKNNVILGDGAMGTELYQRGVFLNSCFDELNLTRSDIVADVHSQYVKAGVDFIETNSFGASEKKLGRFGLGDRVIEINTKAVQIARSAAGDNIMVAGAVGPIETQFILSDVAKAAKLKKQFQVQIKALADAGVDFIQLETFLGADQLQIAIEAAAICSLPVIAQLTTNEFQETAYGQRLTNAISQIQGYDQVVAVGINCSVGPAMMLNAVDTIRKATDKPIAVHPNAGMPREVDGRQMYMCTPEYMAEYAKRFFEKGVKIIGGCCGTSAAHIKEIVKTIRGLDKAAIAAHQSVITITDQAKPQGTEPIPLAQRSSFGQKLVSGEKITTIEITPPRGADLSTILEKARVCASHGIDAINIPDGPRASSRVSPLVTAIEILRHTDIEPLLHVCCRDRNIIGIQSDLLGAQAIGLRNMLFITGDPPKLGHYPDATAVFDMDAIGLTHAASALNRGIDIGGNEFTPPLSMVIGVGANPVAAELDREIQRYISKVKAGAEYAITQPIFDPQMLYDFLDATKDYAIPVIAGIWPFASFKNAEFMANEVPGVVVPDAMLKRMSAGKTKEQGRELGIQIARELIDEISDRVAGFAVSAPFGNVNIALAALNKIKLNQI